MLESPTLMCVVESKTTKLELSMAILIGPHTLLMESVCHANVLKFSFENFLLPFIEEKYHHSLQSCP